MLIVLILSVFASKFANARPQIPHVVDLRDLVNNQNCWDEQGQFDSKSCSKTESSCNFESRIENSKKTDIKIQLPDGWEKLIKSQILLQTDQGRKLRKLNWPSGIHVYDKKVGSFVYQSPPNEIVVENLPEGLEGSILIKDSLSIKRIKDFTIQANTIVKDLKIDQIQYPVLFEFESGVVMPGVSFNFLDQDLPLPYNVTLSKGKYSYSLQAYDGDRYKITEDFEVREGTNLIKIKKIPDFTSKAKFVPIGGESFPIKAGLAKRFYQIKKVISFESKKDVTNLFKINNGNIEISQGKESEVQTMLSRPLSILDFEAICIETEYKPIIAVIKVHANPSRNSPTLGSFEIHDHKQSEYRATNIFFLKGKNKISYRFEDLANDCEGDVPIVRVFSEENGWSKLGQGPWGKSGWIELKSYSIIDRNKFQFEDYYSVEFSEKGDNYLVEGWKITDGEYNKVEDKIVTLKDIFKEEFFIPMLQCKKEAYFH